MCAFENSIKMTISLRRYRSEIIIANAYCDLGADRCVDVAVAVIENRSSAISGNE